MFHLPPDRPRLAVAALLVGAAVTAVPDQAGGQTLRGSRASIDRMYRQAVEHDLTFFKTAKAVTRAAGDGEFARLPLSTAHYRLHQVSYPYVVPAVKVFVERLAEQYHGACGERLVVTSAMRPSSQQPSNSTARSVHPTGMAIDLRKPNGKCLTWLRTTLVALEKKGVIEATEERRPPHFHIAIFPEPYARYLGPGAPAQLASGAKKGGRAAITTASATSTAADARAAYRRYEVRSGDTLWHLARRYGTTIKQLRSINQLRSSTLRPGQELLVPAQGAG